MADQLGLADHKEAIVSRAVVLLKAWYGAARRQPIPPLELGLAAASVAIRYTAFPREFTYRAILDAARVAGVALPAGQLPGPDGLHAAVQALQSGLCGGHELYPVRRAGTSGLVCARCFAMLPPDPPGFAAHVPTRVLASATAAVQAAVKAGTTTIEGAVAGAVKAYQRSRLALEERPTVCVIAGLATLSLDGARFGDLVRQLGVPRATLKDAIACVQGKDTRGEAPLPKPHPSSATSVEVAAPIAPNVPPVTQAPVVVEAKPAAPVTQAPVVVEAEPAAPVTKLADTAPPEKRPVLARKVRKAIPSNARAVLDLETGLVVREACSSPIPLEEDAAAPVRPATPSAGKLYPHLVKEAAQLVGELGGDAGKDAMKRLQGFVLDHHRRLLDMPRPEAQPAVVAAIELGRQGYRKGTGQLAAKVGLTLPAFKALLGEYEAFVPVPEACREGEPKPSREEAIAATMADLAKQVPAASAAMPAARACLHELVASERGIALTNGPFKSAAKRVLLLACKRAGAPVTTRQLGLTESEYTRFLSKVKGLGLLDAMPAGPGAAPAALSITDIVDKAMDAATRLAHVQAGRDTRAAVERFYRARQALFGGTKATIEASVLACILVARRDPAVRLTDVAGHFGLRDATVFNAVTRVLGKVGKPSEPHVPIFDRVRAAFPPRGIQGNGKDEEGTK